MEDLNSHLCKEGIQTDSEHKTRCPRGDSQWGRWKWRETSGGSTSPSLGWLFEKKSEQSKSWEQRRQRSPELKTSPSPSANAEDAVQSEFSSSCWRGMQNGTAAAENGTRALHRVKQTYSVAQQSHLRVCTWENWKQRLVWMSVFPYPWRFLQNPAGRACQVPAVSGWRDKP